MMMPITAPSDPVPIECRRLTRRFGTIAAVDELDLAVPPGSVTGLLGPNGAGKTTLLDMLAGLLRPSAGEARLFGLPPSEAAARRRIGFTPEQPAFFPHLTGLANLELLGDLQGDGASPDRAWALETLGFSQRELGMPAASYSAGTMQKLGLVQAVQHRPDLVLLDEPANRLDPFSLAGFRELISEIARQGRTVLVSSHALGEVESLCDTVALLRSGRLLVRSSVRDLAARALRTVTVRYRRPPASFHPDLLAPRLTGTVLTANLPAGSVGVVRSLASDPDVEDLLLEGTGLEEAFLDLYRKADSGPPPKG